MKEQMLFSAPAAKAGTLKELDLLALESLSLIGGRACTNANYHNCSSGSGGGTWQDCAGFGAATIGTFASAWAAPIGVGIAGVTAGLLGMAATAGGCESWLMS